jgi:hypothetical protein
VTPSRTRTRLGALCLAIAGAMFVLYPAVRPWTDESTVDGATSAMASNAWVASHLFAMIGFILVPLGLLALWGVLSSSRVEPLALAAVVASWIGAGLTLPYYGAEDFGLHAVAVKAAAGESVDLLGIVDGFRFHPVAATIFGAGLVTLAVGAILAAVAVWRSAILPKYAGVPFALGLALFIPQFFTPPLVRVSHGVLLGIGCAWLALTLWRSPARSERPTAVVAG